jgi:hypothetical protein
MRMLCILAFQCAATFTAGALAASEFWPLSGALLVGTVLASHAIYTDHRSLVRVHLDTVERVRRETAALVRSLSAWSSFSGKRWPGGHS